MGRSRYKFGDDPYPSFLTCTVVAWLPVFTRSETVQIVLDSWRFLQDRQRLVLLGYVILENHLHLVAGRRSVEGDRRLQVLHGPADHRPPPRTQRPNPPETARIPQG